MATGTLTADGQSDTVKLRKGVAIVSDDLGGGTAAVQVEDPNHGTWVTLTDGSLTAAGAVGLDFPFPMDCRIDLSGSTTPNADWTLTGDEE